MAGKTPYICTLSVVLTASAQGTLAFQVPAGQRFTVKEWFWTSTGIFSLFDIRMQTSLRITNASLTTPILSTFLRNPGNAFIMLDDLMLDWVIEPNNSLFLDVIDTSVVGNTVRAVLNGAMEYI